MSRATARDWAELEVLLTAAHEAGRAVGHVTDYPNLSKHYARYTTEAMFSGVKMKTIQEFPEENEDDT